MMQTLPEFVTLVTDSMDAIAAAGNDVKWSNVKPPPPVGARLHIPVEYENGPLGEVEVVGYSVEYGWLALMVRPTRKNLSLTKEGLKYVYGVDIP